MTASATSLRALDVAVLGAGPAGIGAAIAAHALRPRLAAQGAGWVLRARVPLHFHARAVRALGAEEVAKKLDGFDWSHIVPRSKGGGDGAANGVFELAGLNRSRGAEQMTAAEIQAAAEVLSQTAFRAAVQQVASRAFAGAVAGAAVACVLACLEEGLAYQRGEIARNEMYARIGRAVAKASAAGAAVSGLMAAVALAFPALIPLVAPLMLPLAVLGLCAVGGKVVCLGKGWYELYQEVSRPRLTDALPVTALPAPGTSPSE